MFSSVSVIHGNYRAVKPDLGRSRFLYYSSFTKRANWSEIVGIGLSVHTRRFEQFLSYSPFLSSSRWALSVFANCLARSDLRHSDFTCAEPLAPLSKSVNFCGAWEAALIAGSGLWPFLLVTHTSQKGCFSDSGALHLSGNRTLTHTPPPRMLTHTTYFPVHCLFFLFISFNYPITASVFMCIYTFVYIFILMSFIFSQKRGWGF